MATTQTAEQLQAERERLDSELSRRGAPAEVLSEADASVEKLDKLLAREDAKLDALRKQRDAIDQEFSVKARAAAERARAEADRQTRAQVEAVLAAEEKRLRAVAKAEAALVEYTTALDEALAANKEANAATKELSGGTWSSFGEQAFVNRMSAHMARHLIAANHGRPIFGQHVRLVPPPEPVGRAATAVESRPTSWRAREERAEAHAVSRVMEVLG